jgi:hypothetical protein
MKAGIELRIFSYREVTLQVPFLLRRHLCECVCTCVGPPSRPYFASLEEMLLLHAAESELRSQPNSIRFTNMVPIFTLKL